MTYHCCLDSIGVAMGTLNECAGSIVGGRGERRLEGVAGWRVEGG